MILKVLFIGGTGQISLSCVEEAIRAGHDVHVFNRGTRAETLPTGAKPLVGDMDDPQAYAALGSQDWDVVAQFLVKTPGQMLRDIETFRGRTRQYVFISSASVYRKLPDTYIVTEATPIGNPYWPYSQAKIDCETLLKSTDGFPWTIVRPSHTLRTALPTLFNDGDTTALRMLAGQPVIVAGDGTSIWTMTRSEDFAKPFIRLFGHDAATCEDFHITADFGFTWDAIYMAIASGLGVKVDIVHVPSEILVRYNAAWAGPLLGDKTPSTLFDNSKIKTVAGDFACERDLQTILSQPIALFRQRLSNSKASRSADDPLIDDITKTFSHLAR